MSLNDYSRFAKEVINTKRSVTSHIKWVGGKRKLLPELVARMPEIYNSYFELFAGSAAPFLALQPEQAHLNDSNSQLINSYQVIKDKPLELMEYLDQCLNNEQRYYEIRNLDRSPQFDQLTDVEQAGRFIYLNKTGFNGLHRTNKRGEFNVSWGKKKTVTYYDRDNILALSKALKNVELSSADYRSLKEQIKPNDLVYLDPPYLNTFANYTKDGFTLEDQVKVKEFCDQITQIGAYFMLSNSANEDIYYLFNDYNVEVIHTRYSVSGKAKGRTPAREVIVTNYEYREVA